MKKVYLGDNSHDAKSDKSSKEYNVSCTAQPTTSDNLAPSALGPSIPITFYYHNINSIVNTGLFFHAGGPITLPLQLNVPFNRVKSKSSLKNDIKVLSTVFRLLHILCFLIIRKLERHVQLLQLLIFKSIDILIPVQS